MTKEELEFMRRMMAERFNPRMLHTQKDRDVLEKGVFRALIWPTMNGNPFIFAGLFMTFASLCFGLGAKTKSRRTAAMLDFRVKFQALTVVACFGGFYVSDLRKKNAEKLKEINEIENELGQS